METGDGSYDEQLAVASCIINRVQSKQWGQSISSVIYADGQFPGAHSGLLDSFLSQGPSKTALKAAKAVLAVPTTSGIIFILILSEGSPLKIIHPIKLWVITVFIRNKLQVIHNIFLFPFPNS